MIADIPFYLTVSMTIASVLFFGSLWFAIHSANKNWRVSIGTAIWLLVWYGIVFILGRKDFFGSTILFIPYIAFAFITLYFFIKRLYFSPILQKIFESVPLHWLMGIQVFRVMGYGFLSFYFLGLLPGAFAIPTGVGDMFVGTTAPIVAYLYFKQKTYARKLALIWNYIGIGDLALSIILGIATYPRPFQLLSTTIPNTLIALFPLVMIPLFAVPVSFLIHLFSLRALRRNE